MIGRTLSHYRILEKLGEGGMGQVYRARDTLLDRTVALKILPTDVASDPERMDRFRQEAKAASALNHPNVTTIYEIGESEGVRFIVMEYIEGSTLRTKISSRPLDTAEIVDIGIQVADALQEAHAHGITHRDIKPANIMITARGQVKVLDFGLAKVAKPAEDSLASEVPTHARTQAGVVMGTVAYMSPEQALGQTVDSRTDVFSLGVLLYEMATGRLPFSGASVTETIERIVHSAPEAVARFNYAVPPDLERIIRKCLEKDRGRRYQLAQELLVDLRNLKRDTESGEAFKPQARPRRQLRPLALSALAAVLVGLAALGVYLLAPQGEAIDSIAVMPFENASRDPQMEYLTDGITESLIKSLSQLPDLKVISRTSVFTYKGREIDPREVGRRLDVRAVLTGRVVQRGEGLSVAAELVDARDNRHLWGEQYNRKLRDLMDVQTEISEAIARHLQIRLTGEDRRRLAKRYTEDTEAYQLYLKGRYFLWQLTEDGMKKGLDHFNQAIAKDPNYGLAYAGLADFYSAAGLWGLLPSKEAFPKGQLAARQALDIDDTLAEAHAALGAVKFVFEWDWEGAEKELARATALDPSSAMSHLWYSFFLVTVARFDECMTEIRRAQELDPLSTFMNSALGLWSLYARDYDEAVAQLERTVQLDPNYMFTHYNLAYGYALKGMYAEAVSESEKTRSLSSSDPAVLALVGWVYAESGRRRDAREVLKQLEQRSTRSYVDPVWVAWIYAGLRENDRAFEWLEKGYAERSGQMFAVKIETALDRLRSDPRYKDLLRRMRFPE